MTSVTCDYSRITLEFQSDADGTHAAYSHRERNKQICNGILVQEVEREIVSGCQKKNTQIGVFQVNPYFRNLGDQLWADEISQIKMERNACSSKN